MFEVKAWHILHNDGQIEHPSRGVSIDVSTAYQRYRLVKVMTVDPYPDPNAHIERHRVCKMIMLADMPEEERERRRRLPKKVTEIADWEPEDEETLMET